MKAALISFLLLATTSIAFANNCPFESLYKKQGWVVHKQNEFQAINTKINQRIADGTKNETIGYDVYAIYNFEFGSNPIRERFIAEMNTWDDFSTNKDEMWGDIAIYTNHDNNSNPVEIHWYENGKRHIVVNPDEAFCINMPPTGTVNAVF